MLVGVCRFQREDGQCVESRGWTYRQRQRHPRGSQSPQLGHQSDVGARLTAAFPPALRISMPHLAAKGWVQATMPLVLWTTLLRLLNLANSTVPGGNSEGVERGILGNNPTDSSRPALRDSRFWRTEIRNVILKQERELKKKRLGIDSWVYLYWPASKATLTELYKQTHSSPDYIWCVWSGDMCKQQTGQGSWVDRNHHGLLVGSGYGELFVLLVPWTR